MKNAITRRAALGLAACLLTGSLIGCGGAGANVRNSTEPVTVSRAIATKGIWFSTCGTPAKDTRIDKVVSFDGEGGATCYNTLGLTFADIEGLSDTEVIDIAAERDEQAFDAGVEDRIGDLESEIDGTRKIIIPRHEDDLQYMLTEGAPAEEIEKTQNIIADMEEDIADYERQIESLKALKYQAPAPLPYRLSTETDDSGNRSVRETLNLKVMSLPVTGDTKLVENEIRFSLDAGDTGCFPVYDSRYAGFVEGDFWTKVGENFLTFELDAPGTEGIEVD